MRAWAWARQDAALKTSSDDGKSTSPRRVYQFMKLYEAGTGKRSNIVAAGAPWQRALFALSWEHSIERRTLMSNKCPGTAASPRRGVISCPMIAKSRASHVRGHYCGGQSRDATTSHFMARNEVLNNPKLFLLRRLRSTFRSVESAAFGIILNDKKWKCFAAFWRLGNNSDRFRLCKDFGKFFIRQLKMSHFFLFCIGDKYGSFYTRWLFSGGIPKLHANENALFYSSWGQFGFNAFVYASNLLQC